MEPAKSRIEKGLCPVCSKPKSEWTRRKDWACCSVECTEKNRENYIFGWPDMRLKVFERDNWRCVKCGAQPTKRVQKKYASIYEHVVKEEIVKLEDYHVDTYGYSYSRFRPDETCTVLTIVTDLIADHINPIAMGGDEWDMNNIQTLCKQCNKLKTAKDINNISKLRVKEKKSKDTKTLDNYQR